MGIFDSISNGIKNHFNKNKEQREMMEKLQDEADGQRLIAFKEAFTNDSREVAIALAKKEASELSGLRKLRAATRARNLSHQEPEPGTFFEKLSNFTKKNKARMQENLARTAEIRALAEKEKQETLQRKTLEREAKIGSQRPLGKTNWKM